MGGAGSVRTRGHTDADEAISGRIGNQTGNASVRRVRLRLRRKTNGKKKKTKESTAKNVCHIFLRSLTRGSLKAGLATKTWRRLRTSPVSWLGGSTVHLWWTGVKA